MGVIARVRLGAMPIKMFNPSAGLVGIARSVSTGCRDRTSVAPKSPNEDAAANERARRADQSLATSFVAIKERF